MKYPEIVIKWEKNAKHILIILPFYGIDASSSITDAMSKEFKKVGFTVHALLYNKDDIVHKSNYWDYVYHLKSTQLNYGKPYYKKTNTDINIDGNDIDDWVGKELEHFVSYLANTINISLCIINYVFLSKAFLGLKQKTLRVLYTHDIFTKRNSRMAEIGLKDHGYYFSTNSNEEKKGLNRADIILAIQQEDAAFFSSLADNKIIDIVPPVPPKQYLPIRKSNSFVIGYLGSTHRPNVDSIINFCELFDFSCGATIKIGGSITGILTKYNLPNKVHLINGYIYNLASFYQCCDLIINPDMLKSGLKIKSLEALSFGKPLVCTKAANIGIGSDNIYQNAASIQECANFVKKLILNRQELLKLREESIKSFEKFKISYSFSQKMAKIIHFAEQKNSNRCYRALNDPPQRIRLDCESGANHNLNRLLEQQTKAGNPQPNCPSSFSCFFDRN